MVGGWGISEERGGCQSQTLGSASKENKGLPQVGELVSYSHNSAPCMVTT